MILNPNGEIIAEFQGELQANLIFNFIKFCFKYYQNDLLPHPNVKMTDTSVIFVDKLCFPSKLCLNGNILFISDSGNNRILIVDVISLDLLHVIGGSNGFQDGGYDETKLNCPQGLAFDSDDQYLYVADTGNDLIRLVDLNERQIRTLCGKYERKNDKIGDYDYIGGKLGLEQSISSPWDVCIYKRETQKFLLIACAGTHQIWLYTFKTVDDQQTSLKWWRNVIVSFDTLICIAGNGKERNRNNSYPLQASFAQPSGLCIDNMNENLYIADSESSTLRVLSLKDGSVKNIVGGDSSQPDNLFAYGDVDGKSTQVRLQHPMDVKIFNENELLIADAYNNKIKIVNVKEKTCKSFIDCLSEPNGLCIDEKNGRIFIADTNNHVIKVIKDPMIVETLAIKFESKYRVKSVDDGIRNDIFYKDEVFIKFEDSFHINNEAPNLWTLELFLMDNHGNFF
jgi:sugar lactone lactonase YvrE